MPASRLIAGMARSYNYYLLFRIKLSNIPGVIDIEV